MVRKIENNEYAKRFTSMTLMEQQVYLSRVGEWNNKLAPILLHRMGEPGARFMTALQCSVGWSDAECRAWEEGVKLMSAFAATDAMFAAAYTDSAKETIRWMTRGLRSVQNGKCKNQNETPSNSPMNEENKPAETVQPIEKKKRGRPRKDEQSARVIAEAAKGEMMTAMEIPDNVRKNDVFRTQDGEEPVRPKHIDQYVHLLPEATQRKAATVKQLLTDLNRARENASLLMDDKQAHPDDIAKWARMATNCDNKVKAIYKELNREWAKLVKSGRVVVDDLGNARALPTEDAEKTEHTEESTPKDQNKRRLLRKWLVDTRRGNGPTREEHVRKWQDTFTEYLTIEGEKAFSDEKIKAAAEHYRIELDKFEVKK